MASEIQDAAHWNIPNQSVWMFTIISMHTGSESRFQVLKIRQILPKAGTHETLSAGKTEILLITPKFAAANIPESN